MWVRPRRLRVGTASRPVLSFHKAQPATSTPVAAVSSCFADVAPVPNPCPAFSMPLIFNFYVLLFLLLYVFFLTCTFCFRALLKQCVQLKLLIKFLDIIFIKNIKINKNVNIFIFYKKFIKIFYKLMSI